MTAFCTFITIGHIFSIIASKDNEEGMDYYLCHFIQAKQKMDHSVIDGEGFEYHFSVMVVTDTWRRQ